MAVLHARFGGVKGSFAVSYEDSKCSTFSTGRRGKGHVDACVRGKPECLPDICREYGNSFFLAIRSVSHGN